VAYTELRIKLRADWYPLPDICVFNQPDPQERYPERPALLWIEILSEEDKMVDVQERVVDHFRRCYGRRFRVAPAEHPYRDSLLEVMGKSKTSR
jgi:Uma2 family endonuclease